MTNPVNSFHTNFGRFYAHPKFALEHLQASTALSSFLANNNITERSDSPYSPNPSVTNITGMLNKSFLPPYYAKLVAEYAIDNLDGLAHAAEKFGRNVAIGQLKAVANQPNPASQIGDEVHNAIDLWVKKELPADHRFSTPTAVHMFEQFLFFMTQIPFKVIRSEFTVWSYEHGFAGTGDLMLLLEDDFLSPQGVLIPKGVWLTDAKTGNQAYPEVAMQTTALSHADVILDSDGNESPMPPIDFQGVVHVRPRSVKLHQLAKTDAAWEAFLACKRLFDWNRFDRDLVLQTPFKTEFQKAA